MLFNWESITYSGYYNGTIVVSARSVKAARKKVMKFAKARYMEERQMYGRPYDENNPEHVQGLENCLSCVAKDLAEKPSTDEVVVIIGGD